MVSITLNTKYSYKKFGLIMQEISEQQTEPRTEDAQYAPMPVHLLEWKEYS